MTPQTVLRLKTAGLLPVAERVAAQHDMPVSALLNVTGRVSPAQAALFRALAAEGQTAPTIAALLGWGEVAVAREVGMPEAAPTPNPKSGARRRLRPSTPPREVPLEEVTVAVPEMLRDMLCLVEERATGLATAIDALTAEREQVKSELEQLRLCLDALGVSPTTTATNYVKLHGDDGTVAAVAARYGVTIDRLLFGSMQRDVCAARRAVAIELVERRKVSSSTVARMLRVSPSAIFEMLRRYGRKRAA